MGKYLWPALVIALAALAAGAWFAFPEERAAAGSAISSFCASFASETKAAWERMMARSAAKDESSATPDGQPEDDDPFLVATTSLVASAEGPRLAADDPDPSSLTPEQRKRKYKELLAAADQRKREVMRANMMKSEVGREALRVTMAFHAKSEELNRLREKHGATDDKLWALRLELSPLRNQVAVANARYKAWKDAHPSEVDDPLADKVYRDLIARSRFYRD